MNQQPSSTQRLNVALASLTPERRREIRAKMALRAEQTTITENAMVELRSVINDRANVNAAIQAGTIFPVATKIPLMIM